MSQFGLSILNNKNFDDQFGISIVNNNNFDNQFGLSIVSQSNVYVIIEDSGGLSVNANLTISGGSDIDGVYSGFSNYSFVSGTYANITFEASSVGYITNSIIENINKNGFVTITIVLQNAFSGIVTKIDTSPLISIPSSGIIDYSAFCPCDFRCDFKEKVFASNANDGIQNDYTDFLFRKIVMSDTVTIELLKDGISVATITDDTYGVYYDGFDSQPLYVGWQADWTAIFNTFSGGVYQVKTTVNLLGQESVLESRYFQLNYFDITLANKTVKIVSYQYGNIQNSEFDFTDLITGGWRSSIRLQGYFGEMNPSIERDIYQDSSFREIQNRDTVNRSYTLKVMKCSESIYERISTVDMLANEIFITSYNLLQESKQENKPVVCDSFDQPRYNHLGEVFFDITLSDRQKNIIKTNVN